MVEREVMELRARVAKLERTLELVVQQLGIRLPVDQPVLGVSTRVLGLARAGDKIGAIKAHREETGADLATAKRAIDELG